MAMHTNGDKSHHPAATAKARSGLGSLRIDSRSNRASANLTTYMRGKQSVSVKPKHAARTFNSRADREDAESESNNFTEDTEEDWEPHSRLLEAAGCGTSLWRRLQWRLAEGHECRGCRK